MELERNDQNEPESKVSLYQKDALQELGNIAAAHAATVLSELLAEEILIGVSEYHIFPIEQLSKGITLNDTQVATVYLDILKQERGVIMFAFPNEKAIWLSNAFLGNAPGSQPGSDHEIEKKHQDAFYEIGNICACAYLNAISKFLDITLVPSPPNIVIDSLEEILRFHAKRIGANLQYALVFKTNFVKGAETLPGLILFMLDVKSQEIILRKFGLEDNIKT
jgi:chemotaxis protein CheC